MTMYKLTPTEKAEKLRTRHHFEAPAAKCETLCSSCDHRYDLDHDCAAHSQVTVESKTNFRIVISCDGYQEKAQ